MNPTRNDLPANKREAVVGLLNARLADVIDLGLQAKQAHWNVKGPNFLSLHELFDRLAGVLTEHVDEIAERITALGGIAEGTVQSIASRTQLPKYSLSLTAGTAQVTAIAEALSVVAKTVRTDIDRTAEMGDAGTADLLTGLSRELDKQLWFVESHLQG